MLQKQNDGVMLINTDRGKKTTQDLLNKSREAITYLTGEIDRLSQRLVEYDKQLCEALEKNRSTRGNQNESG